MSKRAMDCESVLVCITCYHKQPTTYCFLYSTGVYRYRQHFDGHDEALTGPERDKFEAQLGQSKRKAFAIQSRSPNTFIRLKLTR